MDGQIQLWCRCGSPVLRAGMCATCLRRARLNREKFDGRRDATVARDGGVCVLCAGTDIVVHHRRRFRLITLCRRHHASIHHRYQLPFGVPELYAQLWREQHQGQALQIELPFDVIAEPTVEQVLLFGNTAA